MKYIKLFEGRKKKYPVEIVGYPEGNIININEEELDGLQYSICPSTGVQFDIAYDNEDVGQWGFNNEEEEEIRDWLEIFRNVGNVDSVQDIRNYNL